MGIRHQQVLNEIFFVHGSGGLSAPPPALSFIAGEGLSLGIAPVRHRHHHVLFFDEVFVGEVFEAAANLRAPLVSILLKDCHELFPNHGEEAGAIPEDLEVAGDFFQQPFVFLDELVLLHAGQAVQAKIKDGLGLLGR